MGICHQRFYERTFFLQAHLPPKVLFYLLNIILHVVSFFPLDTQCGENVVEKEGGQPCGCPPV